MKCFPSPPYFHQYKLSPLPLHCQEQLGMKDVHWYPVEARMADFAGLKKGLGERGLYYPVGRRHISQGQRMKVGVGG